MGVKIRAKLPGSLMSQAVDTAPANKEHKTEREPAASQLVGEHAAPVQLAIDGSHRILQSRAIADRIEASHRQLAQRAQVDQIQQNKKMAEQHDKVNALRVSSSANTSHPLGDTLQLVNGKKNGNMPRPSFRGHVKGMRKEAKTRFPKQNIHMAHRLSWESIRDKLRYGKPKEVEKLTENLTVPARNFGDPSKGGVAKGDQRLYNVAKFILRRDGPRSRNLASLLNSSPFNLRPGDGQVNSSIGGNPDAHHDETVSGRPMTPQSATLLPPGTTDSSDFMPQRDLRDWEQTTIGPALDSAVKFGAK